MRSALGGEAVSDPQSSTEARAGHGQCPERRLRLRNGALWPAERLTYQQASPCFRNINDFQRKKDLHYERMYA